MDCPRHGAKVIELPWAGKHSRFTLLFEAFAIGVLQAAKSVKDAAKILRIKWQQAHGIMEAAVKRGMARRTAEEVRSWAWTKRASSADGVPMLTPAS